MPKRKKAAILALTLLFSLFPAITIAHASDAAPPAFIMILP